MKTALHESPKKTSSQSFSNQGYCWSPACMLLLSRITEQLNFQGTKVKVEWVGDLYKKPFFSKN